MVGRAGVWYRFAPVIAWMAVIFVMSSRAGSTDHSTRLVSELVARLTPTFAATLTPYQWECMDYGFRKACHVAEYGLLALLLMRAMRLGNHLTVARAAVTAFVAATAYAATDEFHQVFVPRRTPSLQDVVIDASGAAVALAIVCLGAGMAAVDRRIITRLDDGVPVRATARDDAAAAG